MLIGNATNCGRDASLMWQPPGQDLVNSSIFCCLGSSVTSPSLSISEIMLDINFDQRSSGNFPQDLVLFFNFFSLSSFLWTGSTSRAL